jgi:hypothetical protein
MHSLLLPILGGHESEVESHDRSDHVTIKISSEDNNCKL